MARTLSSKQIRFLRGLAHHLDPVVQSGKAGMTVAIMKEIDRNLKDHELIKVRLNFDERSEFLEAASHIAESTRSTLVQAIGRIALLYRKSEKPTIKLPQ